MRFIKNLEIGGKMDEYVDSINCTPEKPPQNFRHRSLAAEHFQENYNNDTLWDFNTIVELTKV